MTATLDPSPLDLWRKRLGGRRRRACPRPLAALGYLINGPVLAGLIPVENLTVVLLYDELIRPGQCALRLAGYCGRRIPWGVRFGGPDNCMFRKDLMLQPIPGGRGYRLDLARADLLTLGLAIDRELDCCARFCQQQLRERPFLPKLWAAFQPADTAKITGDGPELAAYAARTRRSPQRLLEQLRREHLGLILQPLAWVSHHWQQAEAVFADLERFPRRQVFCMQRMPDDLMGFHDAVEFDFNSHSPAGADSKEPVKAGGRTAVMA